MSIVDNMADVAVKPEISSQKNKPCYFPTLPPSPSKAATSYAKYDLVAGVMKQVIIRNLNG
jgi:hypothetical protein